LTEAFHAKKQMNPFITDGTPIEPMLDAARGAGATGGKICGAGGGGYLLIAAPPAAQERVRGALTALGGQFAPFAFSGTGVRATRGGRTWSPHA
jgi:D-glycero-alpha-D-manno-heptose-7-phosphate kinase